MADKTQKIFYSPTKFGALVASKLGDIAETPCPLCGQGMQYNFFINALECKAELNTGFGHSCPKLNSLPDADRKQFEGRIIAQSVSGFLLAIVKGNQVRVELDGLYTRIALPIDWYFTTIGIALLEMCNEFE